MHPGPFVCDQQSINQQVADDAAASAATQAAIDGQTQATTRSMNKPPGSPRIYDNSNDEPTILDDSNEPTVIVLCGANTSLVG